MIKLVIAMLIGLSLCGCVPLIAGGVVGYEMGKNDCWRQPPAVRMPDGSLRIPPPVRVC
jgi:hypothetical protein